MKNENNLKRFPKITRVCCFLSVFLVFTCVVFSFEEQEKEILKLLPHGSQIAEIPVILYRLKNSDGSIRIKYETRKGIIRADLTGDKKEEIIVGFYTPPHDYFIEKNGKKIPDENFFQRAHVAIFKTTEKGLEKCWESDGFGNVFGIKFLPFKREKEKLEYPWYIFGVEDIDGNKLLEIVFSRTGYNAMGGKTEIWGWNGKEYIKKLETKGELTFTTTDKGSEIISVDYYAGEVYITHFLYNKTSYRYKPISWTRITPSQY